MTLSFRERLAELGRQLPQAPAPVATYAPVIRSGNILYVSGQISQREGQPAFLGRLGAEVSVEEGRAAAESAVMAVIAHVSDATQGRREAVARVLRVAVYVAATPDFTEHPQVANGASDLLVEVLGERGRHTRVAMGVASLPRGVCVEVEAQLELVA